MAIYHRNFLSLTRTPHNPFTKRLNLLNPIKSLQIINNPYNISFTHLNTSTLIKMLRNNFLILSNTQQQRIVHNIMLTQQTHIRRDNSLYFQILLILKKNIFLSMQKIQIFINTSTIQVFSRFIPTKINSLTSHSASFQIKSRLNWNIIKDILQQNQSAFQIIVKSEFIQSDNPG